MTRGTRRLYLDICDYNNTPICSLYDNHSDVSGQAFDVHVITERDGWKELSFRLPSTCLTDEGEEENYRLQYLIADYRILLRTENETDVYVISEPRISHDGPSKSTEVIAGHVSQLLKTKNLNLEFSDDEGNNVGTAEQLLTTILDGTGWKVGYVEKFLEDDGVTTKVRSFVSSVKTGAFKMVADMCEKFDAKPVYHGYEKTVDIVSMNPFAEVEDSEIPQEVMNGKNVLELNYGRNVTNVSRTLNTENIVTRLYAYGAYGDKTNGLCSLQTVLHREYEMTLGKAYPAQTEFYFVDENNNKHYFIINEAGRSSDVLIWSDMDPLSRSYVWNSRLKVPLKTYKLPEKDTQEELVPSVSFVQNNVDYLMDFSYYEKIGLLTDEMKNELASFQRNTPQIVQQATEASKNFIQSQTDLSRIAESNTGFLRLDIDSYDAGPDNELVLNINKLTYDDGVIYRSDYDEARRNYFSWYCADALKDNGDPVSGIGSVVYIIHNTNPVTWEKAYLKAIDGEQRTQDYSIRGIPDPNQITLWLHRSKVPSYKSTDRFYLFATNSISGQLGVRESEIESLQQTLDQATKVITEKHPTYFVWDDDPAPSLEVVGSSYGWYYRTKSNEDKLGQLYFCYGIAGDASWKAVTLSETEPEVVFDSYYFNLKQKKLYHAEGTEWVDISTIGISFHDTGRLYYAPDAEAKRINQGFSKVAYYCRRYDMLYKGMYKKYSHTRSGKELSPGNYAIKSEFGFFWVFTTDQTIPKGKSLWLDTDKYLVFQDEDVANVVTPEAKPYEAIDFPVANEIKDVSLFEGTIKEDDGTEQMDESKQRTNYLPIYGGVLYEYQLPVDTYIFFYDANKSLITSRHVETNSEAELTTNIRTKYMRIVFSKTVKASHYFRVYNYNARMFLKDKQYIILASIKTSGERTGMNNLIKSFADTADACYLNYFKTYKEAQAAVTNADNALKNTLQDLYREGYWQKNEYVEGDEEKLYKDALDNLRKIAKPEATYDVRFIDLYAANQDEGYSVDESLEDASWPDIDISDAIHLIDEEIDVNCWAFIDKLDKCYDKPWETQLAINTDLSLIAQHSFTDVLTRIAEVSNETSAKQTIYKRAAAISGTGAYTANKLEGTINANKVLFDGGASNWYTDAKGNLVFESSDGQSAMKLTGYGFCVANAKDEWGDWIFRTYGTGDGFSADEIVTGEMSAVHITAGSIETDRLSASVGQELEIGSNKALTLFATIDGLKPAGGVFTPQGKDNSYIEIAAAKGDNPAYINIASGGNVTIDSGSSIKMNAGSTFEVSSKNFTIDENGNVTMKGTVTARAGNIAGFTIDYSATPAGIYQYMYSGRDKDGNPFDYVTAEGLGTYFGTNGINIGGRLVYTYAGKESYLKIHATQVHIGDINAGIAIKDKELTVAGSAAVNILSGSAINILNGDSNAIVLNKDGISVESAGAITVQNKGKISMKSGSSVELLANSSLSIKAGSDIILVAGSKLTLAASSNVTIAGASLNIASDTNTAITTNGTITIGKSGKEFTIGADGTVAYIYKGMSSLNDTNNNGIYVGTNGIALGKGIFKVTDTGVLTAESANIRGSITATSGLIGAKQNNNGTVSGGWTIAQDLIYAGDSNNFVALSTAGNVRIFAGSTDPTSPGTDPTESAFYVTKTGAMYASNATIAGKITSEEGSIGGWEIGENYLRSTDTNHTVGLYSWIPEEGSTDSGRVFWAGGPRSGKGANTPTFYVKYDGSLTATSANIVGDVNATTLKINGTVVPTTNSAAFIETTNGQIQLSSIQNGSHLASFTVDGNGVSTLVWDSATQQTSAVSIKSSGISLNGTGALQVAMDNIEINNEGTVEITGTIIAKEGRIGATVYEQNQERTVEGGWVIGENRLYSSVSENSLTSYIELNSDPSQTQSGGTYSWTQPYAFWVGSSTASEAPFRVKRDGSVYLTKLMVYDENERTEKEADLFNPNTYAFWRKNQGSLVTGSTDKSITLSSGVTINFKTAADVEAAAEVAKNAVSCNNVEFTFPPNGSITNPVIRVKTTLSNEKEQTFENSEDITTYRNKVVAYVNNTYGTTTVTVQGNQVNKTLYTKNGDDYQEFNLAVYYAGSQQTYYYKKSS